MNFHGFSRRGGQARVNSLTFFSYALSLVLCCYCSLSYLFAISMIFTFVPPVLLSVQSHREREQVREWHVV